MPYEVKNCSVEPRLGLDKLSHRSSIISIDFSSLEMEQDTRPLTYVALNVEPNKKLSLASSKQSHPGGRGRVTQDM